MKMFWDSFLCERQIDEYDYVTDECWPEIPEEEEINPDEYDDWCAYCAMMDMLDD